MKNNKEKELTIQLLTEKIQRLSGKKVVFKEQAIKTSSFVDLVKNAPKNVQVTVDYVSDVKMNKTGKNEVGEKIANPFIGKEVKKHNIVSGVINFDYSEEVNKDKFDKGEETDFKPKARAWGVKPDQGKSIVEHNGGYYLEIQVKETAKPTFTVDGELVSKSELVNFLPSSNSTSNDSGVVIRTINFKTIENLIIGNKEYQLTESKGPGDEPTKVLKEEESEEEIITADDFGAYCTWVEDGVEKRDNIITKTGVSKDEAYEHAKQAKYDWDINAPVGQKTSDVSFKAFVAPLSKIREEDEEYNKEKNLAITENEEYKENIVSAGEITEEIFNEKKDEIYDQLLNHFQEQFELAGSSVLSAEEQAKNLWYSNYGPFNYEGFEQARDDEHLIDNNFTFEI